jgi:L-ascorbate metabolism protein UlaG (beta-lactamase superfamily)
MLTGKQLIADINACQPQPGQLGLWWLGQQSFVVKLGRTVAWLDPFLSEHRGRQIPPMLLPEELTNADLICGSHDHVDHIDRAVWPALSQASPQAKFVVADLLREGLARDLKIPLDRFIGLDDGKTVDIAGIKVSAVPAAHEFLDQDPATGRYPHLGYILEGNGCTLFHAGDTCLYEGFQARLRRWKFDVMCLPINGRDAERLARRIIGNMTYQEAADLAGELKPGCVIPAHWDMFARNPGDPNAFAAYVRVKYPGQQVLICEHGVRVILPQ